jgi:hypothetical protein
MEDKKMLLYAKLLFFFSRELENLDTRENTENPIS